MNVNNPGVADGAITLAKLAASVAAALVPAGAMLPFGGSGAAPTGFLLCDGSAVSRTTFAALFTAIGISHGAGDGSTTFNVPNMARRVPVGKGGAGTATLANTVGATGGEEAHALTGAENGPHVHGPGAGNAFIDTVIGGGGSGFSGGTDAISRDGSTASAGSGTAHNTMQPSLVVGYIIKT